LHFEARMKLLRAAALASLISITGLTALIGLTALTGCGCDPGGPNGETHGTFYLTDSATGAPIANPTFSENGVSLFATCAEVPATGTPCSAQVITLVPAAHVITIDADGYTPDTVRIDLTGGEAHVAVALQRSRS
jgi:hypothetical protein